MTFVSVAGEMRNCVPELILSCIECNVSVSEATEGLWTEIDQKAMEIASSVRLEQISGMPAIAASRRAYKACGKDPARYRLSAEALLRRTVQGKGLYRVNNVVDLLNLVSLSSGFSIGGYDASKIQGKIVFGIGRENEPYQGIGRGELNIESLPVFRDDAGAFGSATSDSVRTAVTTDTLRFLLIIIDFGTTGLLDDADGLAVNLLQGYAGAENIEKWRV
jgi:DNA/RNA-binding domain of Phe-tRNA-synthetase-like protein